VNGFYEGGRDVKLRERLLSPEVTAVLQARSLPPVSHVDLYYQQHEELELNNAYNTPAVFLDAGLSEEKTLGRGVKDSTAFCTLYIEVSAFGNTSSRSSDRDANTLLVLGYWQIIKSAVEGLSGELFGSLRAVRSEPVQKIKSSYVRAVEFAFHAIDSNAHIDCHIIDGEKPIGKAEVFTDNFNPQQPAG